MAKDTFGLIFHAMFRCNSLPCDDDNVVCIIQEKSHFEICPFAMPPTKSVVKIFYIGGQLQPIHCWSFVKVVYLLKASVSTIRPLSCGFWTTRTYLTIYSIPMQRAIQIFLYRHYCNDMAKKWTKNFVYMLVLNNGQSQVHKIFHHILSTFQTYDLIR